MGEAWNGINNLLVKIERLKNQLPRRYRPLVAPTKNSGLSAVEQPWAEKQRQAAGKDVTTKIYKNAGHAFLADYRPSYREAAAQELWGDVQSFFGKHLK